MLHRRDSASTASGARRVVDAYYLATPLFALLDLAGGVNVRLVALDEHTGARVAYYALCLACLVAMRALPRFAPLVALLEGSVTLLLLVLGVLMPLLRAPELIDGGAAGFSPTVESEAVVNLVLSGGAWLFALYGNPLLLGSRRAW
jgi:hypothetical protein